MLCLTSPGQDTWLGEWRWAGLWPPLPTSASLCIVFDYTGWCAMVDPFPIAEPLVFPAPGSPGTGALPRLSRLDAPSQDLESCMSDNSTEEERWHRLCLGVFEWGLAENLWKQWADKQNSPEGLQLPTRDQDIPSAGKGPWVYSPVLSKLCTRIGFCFMKLP